MENILLELPEDVQERISKDGNRELEKQLSRIEGLTIPDKIEVFKEEFKNLYSKGESKLWFMSDAKDKKIAELTEIIQNRAK